MRKEFEAHEIDALLQRFFDGGTTCAEEKILAEWFVNNDNLPLEYEPYKDMFKWLVSGMDESAIPSERHNDKSSGSVKDLIRLPVLRLEGIAAAILIAVALGSALYVNTMPLPTSQQIESINELDSELRQARTERAVKLSQKAKCPPRSGLLKFSKMTG